MHILTHIHLLKTKIENKSIMYPMQPLFPMSNQPSVYGQPFYSPEPLKGPEKLGLLDEKLYKPEICCDEKNFSSNLSGGLGSNSDVANNMDNSNSIDHHSHPSGHERIPPPKDVQCSVCKKGFSNTFFLKIHERIHTGRNLLGAQPAQKHSPNRLIYGTMNEFTQARNLLSVQFVGKHLVNEGT